MSRWQPVSSHHRPAVLNEDRMLAPDGARALERVLLQLEPELERRRLKCAEVRESDVVVLAVEEPSKALPLALLGRR